MQGYERPRGIEVHLETVAAKQAERERALAPEAGR